VARLAVVGLAAGLAVLAAVALWATESTARTSAEIRALDETGYRWTQVLLHVSGEYEALTDFLIADSETGKQPLESSVGSATDDLAWLASHGADLDREQATAVATSYVTYTTTLRALIAADLAGDERMFKLKATEAGLSSSSVRKQAVANASRKHQDLSAAIDDADSRNAQLRTAEGTILGVDAVLLALSGLLLLNHQRRIERQAVRDRHQAMHDSLTGAANRVLLGERLERAVAASVAGGPYGALLVLDLDRFKQVNDTLGHHQGDLLLREVAARLNDLVGEDDLVARLGGDEFAVLLAEVEGTPAAIGFGERVRDSLNCPAVLEGTAVPMLCSIGVAVFPEHGSTATELLQHADIAMYAAKRSRSGVAGYRVGDGEALTTMLALQAELERAIRDDEMVLYYQPKVQLHTGAVAGVEALVRWQHPRQGLLGPAEILLLTEQGKIDEALNAWVLRAALRQHREWRMAGMLLPIAVNYPGSLLLDDELPGRIAEMMAEYGCPPGQLSLEITEGAVIDDADRASSILFRLREAGVETSIDDFGTGFSSMSRLLTLPLDELKIDREFTGALNTRNGDAIVRTTVQLGHALGLRVVAEGVEDAETLVALTGLGCDQAQGYYICRPVDAEGLRVWFDGQRVGGSEARGSEPLPT